MAEGIRGYGIQVHARTVARFPGLEELKTIGLERLVFRVFENGPDQPDGVTFSNRHSKPLEDVSGKNVQDAKACNMTPWAWMNSRSMTWAYRAGWMDPGEWPGRRVPEDLRLDLFNPEVIKLIREYYQDLAQVGYRGILIQDDLILKRYEGLSVWGRKKFSQALGLPAEFMKPFPKDPSDAVNWRRIKMTQVNHVLASIVGAVHEVDPGISVGVNVYYESALKPGNAEDWYAQSIPELLWTGVDEIHLMAYHRQMMKEMGWSFGEMCAEYRNMLEKALEMAGAEHLVVKIQTRDWVSSESIPFEELKSVVGLMPEKVRMIVFTPVKEEEWKTVRDVVQWDRTRKR